MDIQAVQTAIAGTLAKQGFHSYDYGPDAPISPAAYVYPEPFSYHADFDDGNNLTFVVRFLIASTASRNGQAALNTLVSPRGAGSAKVLIEADPTLGGVVDDAQAMGMRDYGVVQLADQGTRYYSAEVLIDVLAS